MFYWCVTLFVMGILAILDMVYSYGEIFRWVNSVLFLLASLGLLVRTRMMIKTGKIVNASNFARSIADPGLLSAISPTSAS